MSESHFRNAVIQGTIEWFDCQQADVRKALIIKIVKEYLMRPIKLIRLLLI